MGIFSKAQDETAEPYKQNEDIIVKYLNYILKS